jgi:hypothetical protein
MPDLSAIAASVVIGLVIAFLLWFALGTQGNIKRGEGFLRWLQTGLPVLGRRTTVRWFGSSAVELTITQPSDPFSQAQAVVVLEPRDLGWLWAIARARGRRDFLIVRARLKRPPAFELEAGDERGWTGADRLKKLDPDAWDQQAWGPVRVAHTHGADTEKVRRFWNDFGALSGGVWRLSIRRDNPHLELHVMPPEARGSAEGLFLKFRELAAEVTKKPPGA